MALHQHGNIKAVKQAGDSTGGPERPISKPLDKAPYDYLANETVPQDDYHETLIGEDHENPGDLSKRFGEYVRPPHKGRP